MNQNLARNMRYSFYQEAIRKREAEIDRRAADLVEQGVPPMQALQRAAQQVERERRQKAIQNFSREKAIQSIIVAHG